MGDLLYYFKDILKFLYCASKSQVYKFFSKKRKLCFIQNLFWQRPMKMHEISTWKIYRFKDMFKICMLSINPFRIDTCKKILNFELLNFFYFYILDFLSEFYTHFWCKNAINIFEKLMHILSIFSGAFLMTKYIL